jgi:hypothetical protein
MFSSRQSFIELLTDALIARCDCRPESVFIVFTVLSLWTRDDFYYWRSVPAIHLRDMLYLCAVFTDCYHFSLCTISEGTSAQIGQSGRRAGILYFSVPDAVYVHSCIVVMMIALPFLKLSLMFRLYRLIGRRPVGSWLFRDEPITVTAEV